MKILNALDVFLMEHPKGNNKPTDDRPPSRGCRREYFGHGGNYHPLGNNLELLWEPGQQDKVF